MPVAPKPHFSPPRRGRGGSPRGRSSSRSDARRHYRTSPITTTLQSVTDREEIYTGPPTAAFTTLRRIRWDRILPQLREQAGRQPRQLQRESPDPFPQEHGVFVSPAADSAVDVDTPASAARPSSSKGAAEETRIVLGEVGMAPVREPTQAERERDRRVEVVSDSLKDVIQHLYDVQAQVHGYLSEAETRDVLVNKITDLTHSLSALTSQAQSVDSTYVPPEVVDYVDDGRNPDIYTRELVEVVQRGNSVLNGKMEAFGSFTEVLAKEMKGMGGEVEMGVEDVMEMTGEGKGVKENGAR